MLRRIAAMILLMGACSGDDAGGDSTVGVTCPSGSNCATTLPSSETAPGTDETASGAADGSSVESDGGSTLGDSGSAGESGGGPGTGDASTTGPDPACIAPTDCDTCWSCASQGACATEYTACLSGPNCTPTLSCIADNCPEQGVTQQCADMCCFSCQMLGTCGAVDAAVACIAQQCAGLCGTASC